MAPTALAQSPLDVSSPGFDYRNPSPKVFPDGIKTAGQHAPLPDLIQPYSAFPKEITGPTVWKADDYKNNPERWTHPFSEDELNEISDAADAFIKSETPLTGISKVRLPNIRPYIYIYSMDKDIDPARTNSLCQKRLAVFSPPCARNSSTARASFCSRASACKNGVCTSPP